MKILKNYKKLTFLHPFLFAFFPVFSLLSHNNDEIPIIAGLRSVIMSAVLVFILLSLSYAFFRQLDKAAWTTSLGAAVFFSYGHIFHSLKGVNIFDIAIARHRILVPLILLVVLIVMLLIFRKKENFQQVTQNLNLFGMVLFALPIIQLGLTKSITYLDNRKLESIPTNQIVSTEDQAFPDIYYLILDGYPRADVLLESFSYDNTPFMNWLENNGFYIATCSQSNYSYTKPAMASTFNFTYLGDQLNPNIISIEDSALSTMLRNSTLQKILGDLNYSIITFETGYKWLIWDRPDFHFSNDDSSSDYYRLDEGLNNFEILLIETTAVSILLDHYELQKIIEKNPRQVHQDKITYIFDRLKDIPLMDGPKFVYAHIISPHPPYIFGASGELLVNKPIDEIEGYRDQVAFINLKLKDVITEIIESSLSEPIIIVQGDHGAVIEYDDLGIDPLQKLAILNAYKLPDFDDEKLYENISPVNTFSLILNHYFGTNFPLLEDLSIYGNESPFLQLPCPIE